MNKIDILKPFRVVSSTLLVWALVAACGGEPTEATSPEAGMDAASRLVVLETPTGHLNLTATPIDRGYLGYLDRGRVAAISACGGLAFKWKEDHPDDARTIEELAWDCHDEAYLLGIFVLDTLTEEFRFAP